MNIPIILKKLPLSDPRDVEKKAKKAQGHHFKRLSEIFRSEEAKLIGPTYWEEDEDPTVFETAYFAVKSKLKALPLWKIVAALIAGIVFGYLISKFS